MSAAESNSRLTEGARLPTLWCCGACVAVLSLLGLITACSDESTNALGKVKWTPERDDTDASTASANTDDSTVDAAARSVVQDGGGASPTASSMAGMNSLPEEPAPAVLPTTGEKPAQDGGSKSNPGARSMDAGSLGVDPEDGVGICGAYDRAYSAWRAEAEAYRQWLDAQSGTEAPTSDGPRRDCLTCATLDECRPPSVQDACADLNACVARHCMCDDCALDVIPGGSLCDCIETCIPDAESTCRMPWNEHMGCIASHCAGSCVR